MHETQQKLSSKRSLGKKKVILALIIVLFLIFIFIGSYLLSTYFQIKQIIVNKGSSYNNIQGLEIFDNTSILTLNVPAASEQLFNSNSYIKSVNIEKKLPSTLYLTISFFQPSANFEASEGYFILSNSGRILKKVKYKDLSLPDIHYYQKLSYSGYKAGDTILFKDIHASLDFLEKSKDLGLHVNSIDIQGFNMIALNTDSQKIIFGLSKAEKDQLYQFERVVRQFKIQGKQFKSLDLRFERVIVGQ